MLLYFHIEERCLLPWKLQRHIFVSPEIIQRPDSKCFCYIFWYWISCHQLDNNTFLNCLQHKDTEIVLIAFGIKHIMESFTPKHGNYTECMFKSLVLKYGNQHSRIKWYSFGQVRLDKWNQWINICFSIMVNSPRCLAIHFSSKPLSPTKFYFSYVATLIQRYPMP